MNAMSGFLAIMNAAPGDIEKLDTAIANCDGTAVPSPETVRSSAETGPDLADGRTAARKNTSCRMASGFSEIRLPSRICPTRTFVRSLPSSSSLPSGPMFFFGFLPFFRAGKSFFLE